MVFAWDSVTKTSTIVEEFAPGTEEMIIGPVAGGVGTTHAHSIFFFLGEYNIAASFFQNNTVGICGS